MTQQQKQTASSQTTDDQATTNRPRRKLSLRDRLHAKVQRTFDGDEGSIIWLVKTLVLGVKIAVESANYWLAERRSKKRSQSMEE